MFDLIHNMRDLMEALMANLSSGETTKPGGFSALMEALVANLSGGETTNPGGFSAPPDRLLLIYDLFHGWTAPLAAKFSILSTTFLKSAYLWLCLETQFWDEEYPLPEVADALHLLLI